MPYSRMKAGLISAAITAPVLLLSTVAFAQPTDPERANSFSGTLNPLNHSGVTGRFTIEQRGQGQIRVHIEATGLEPGPGPHPGHIHGLMGNTNSTCPTLAQDDDNDGFIELAEGLDTYGPIIVPFGDVDPDDDGVVDFTMRYNLNKSSTFNGDMDKEDLLPLELREIVLHGMTLEAGEGGDGGEADGTAGYKAVLPVACGAIELDPRHAMKFRTPK